MNKGLTISDSFKNHYTEKPFRSRFDEDFVEIEKLGRGGYGSVYKVQNKLDGLLYALKKIQFKNSSAHLLEKVLREVKTLAQLHHPNVVRYHTAWLEEDDGLISIHPDFSEDDVSHTGEETDDHSHSECHDDDSATEGEDDDSMDQFNPFRYDESWELPSHTPPHEQNFHNKNLINGHVSNPLKSTHYNVPVPSSSSSRRHSPTSRRNNSMVNVTTLFIVMQLYSTTLSQFLEARSHVDPSQNIQIFRQICKGLQYIHSRGVIHRDLKPGNIFLSQTSDSLKVCVGDFGLAITNGSPPPSSPNNSPSFPMMFPPSSSPTSAPESGMMLSSSLPAISCFLTADPHTQPYSGSYLGRSWEAKKHTSAVGTLTYASPEQRSKAVYNEKTDIFSLGVIFFELFYISGTKMEKARVLADLRNRILPSTFLEMYPNESALIMRLMSPNPDERPSVEQILACDLLADEHVSVTRKELQHLESKVEQQQTIICEQQQHIQMLEKRLSALLSRAHDFPHTNALMHTDDAMMV